MLAHRCIALLAFTCVSLASRAEVVAFDVLQSAPAFEGRSFGAVGPYVSIKARATIALDPADPRNAVIADIDKAPRDARGRVLAYADVNLLKPADPARGNHTLLVDVPNRGTRLSPQLFDDVPQPGANRAEKAADAGIGFLERQGYLQAWIGWQADIPSAPLQMALAAPVVLVVTGPARDEFQFDHLRNPIQVTLSSAISDPASVKVSVRAQWADQRQTPEGLSIRATGAQTAEITRPASGFDAGALYEVTYQAKDPVVYGIGFAAMRDVTAFLRHDTSASNPLAQAGQPTVVRAIGFGVSQSGRYLRDFLWLGFNQDLNARMVFDGLMPHVAGSRRMDTNYRFGHPSRNSRHPQDPAWTADLFPFTYAVMDDPLSGRRDGLLLRCEQSKTCPKIMQTDSEHEWWASKASLLVTDLQGNHIDLPDNVRAYMIVGTPHFADPGEVMRKQASMALPVNPLQSGSTMRALLTDMQQWISEGILPPSSRVPMRSAGTLVSAANAVSREFTGLPYEAIYTRAMHSDFTVLPPKPLGSYPVFVPLADMDGMAIAGIRLLALQVPKASYIGWNPRAPGFGPGALYALNGAVVPFAQTPQERQARGDPRLSVLERYGSEPLYVLAVQVAAASMVNERLMLPEDAERAIELARKDKLSQLH